MNLSENILDTLFPIPCPSCELELDRRSSYICFRCAQNGMFGISSLLCPICASRIPSGIICRLCRRKTALKRFFAATSYRNEHARNILWLLKYQFAASYAPEIAYSVTAWIQRCGIHQEINRNNTVVVPVPLSRKRKRMRSFNQSELIGRHVAENLALPFEKDALMKVRETIPQSSIARHDARKNNVEGAFEILEPERIKQKTILLVDDVYTSGATMEECARVLKREDAKEVWGVVFAKG